MSYELTGTLRWLSLSLTHTQKHKPLLFDRRRTLFMCRQVPDQYGTIRAVSEGKGDEFLVGTSRNFILRGTFNDGFLGVVQVSGGDVAMTTLWVCHSSRSRVPPPPKLGLPERLDTLNKYPVLSGLELVCVLYCEFVLSVFFFL